MTWAVLFLAGLFETVWALALKESHGFSKLGPTIVFLVGLIISMVLLAWALRDLPWAPATPCGRAPALLARLSPA